MVGQELRYTPNSSLLERLYIQIWGVPISGLRIRMRRLKPFFSGDPDTILDAGCGRGVFSYELAKHFPRATVTGVDIDDKQVVINNQIARAAKLPNLHFETHDIAALPFREQFDFVLSVDNLEHLENDSIGIAALHRALKPQGRLLLHVPGYERRWFWFGFTTNFDVPGHFRPGYWRDEIIDKLIQGGFEVEHAQYTYGWLETISNNISYQVTGAEAKNKLIYALIFPLLNLIAWFGRQAKPERGAGVLLVARKGKS